MAEKIRIKCKDCKYAQKCCGAYVLCTQFNYMRRHLNSKTCASFKPRKEMEK